MVRGRELESNRIITDSKSADNTNVPVDTKLSDEKLMTLSDDKNFTLVTNSKSKFPPMLRTALPISFSRLETSNQFDVLPGDDNITTQSTSAGNSQSITNQFLSEGKNILLEGKIGDVIPLCEEVTAPFLLDGKNCGGKQLIDAATSTSRNFLSEGKKGTVDLSEGKKGNVKIASDGVTTSFLSEGKNGETLVSSEPRPAEFSYTMTDDGKFNHSVKLIVNDDLSILRHPSDTEKYPSVSINPLKNDASGNINKLLTTPTNSTKDLVSELTNPIQVQQNKETS